jgi:hypothetical protein
VSPCPSPAFGQVAGDHLQLRLTLEERNKMMVRGPLGSATRS